MRLSWLSLLLFAEGCSHLAPVGPRYRIPEPPTRGQETPEAAVRVTPQGVRVLGPDRYLQVRFEVANKQPDKTLTLDVSRQRLSRLDHVPLDLPPRAVEIDGEPLEAPMANVRPDDKRVFDLYYPLPRTARPEPAPSFELAWAVPEIGADRFDF